MDRIFHVLLSSEGRQYRNLTMTARWFFWIDRFIEFHSHPTNYLDYPAMSKLLVKRVIWSANAADRIKRNG